MDTLLPDVKTINQLEKIKFNLEIKINKYIESNTIFINESGLYSLILSSKMADAKEFRRWVTNDVLVSIRKTGSYNIVKNGKIFDEHKLKELEDKSCIYIIKIKNSI
jgi:prophage antirepressor-like protein